MGTCHYAPGKWCDDLECITKGCKHEPKKIIDQFAEYLASKNHTPLTGDEKVILGIFEMWRREQACRPSNLPGTESGGRAGGEQSSPVSMTLLHVESLALSVGLGQVKRGETPMPNIATMCVLALARLTGKHDWVKETGVQVEDA